MDKEPNSKTYYQNPAVDKLFLYIGQTIPSKKEDFKPVDMSLVIDDGTEEILNDFYRKKPSSQSVRNFERMVREGILQDYSDSDKILKPALVEVVIAISLKKEKYFDIDVDNVAKTVLDTLTGFLFEDDSQVMNLICKKDVHPLNMESFFIAVTELKAERKGILGDLSLFSANPWKANV